ncbi:TPA: hypothetical protein SJ432_002872 [Yersinia enterocolitica]|nr:hypothetical protein [Yersinia enterocolitica]
MNNIEELKRFIYSATVTSGSGSQSFYIDAKSREEADARAANNESNGMYADDSEITDLDALEYEDETTVDDFGDFPLISREQSLIAQLEAAQKERDEFRLAFQQNEQAKQELFAQKDLLITANLNISRRAEKAEAELSAANEKLKGEQVPVEYQYRYHNHGTGCGEWCRVLTKERYEELQREHAGDNDFVFRMLFTAPQKPINIDASVIRDANRYRFLRDEDSWGEDSDSWDWETKTGLISWENLCDVRLDDFDAAIDARMAASDIPPFNVIKSGFTVEGNADEK